LNFNQDLQPLGLVRREGTNVRPSIRIASLAQTVKSAAGLVCLLILLGFATFSAGAQTTVSPTSNTIQVAGAPIAQSSITAPTGGMVLYGTAINPITSQPVRHLWVGDSTAGLCRTDPDLDSPAPYAVNPATCLTGASVLGGAMALDSVNNRLYFVDNQKLTQGVLRISYLPGGDSGQGSLDPTTLFDLAGNQAGTSFAGGQTGCALPGNPGAPNAVTLDPEGNLWIGFGKSAEIIRINNPGTASATNFGTCAQFVQVAASVLNNRLGAGLAWIGHDLWGANSQTPFVIPRADTACLTGTNPACSTANGTVVQALSSIPGAIALVGDQFFPATNGNNLYFASGSNIAWVGNVVGGPAGQTLTLTYINAAQAQLANTGTLALDATDPANLVLYSGDDPSGLATAGAGRWFQTIQTSAAPGPPGTPLDVQASGGQSQVTVSWSPAQVAQPVTSYTVHNSFASNGLPINDVVITPSGGSLYPQTSAAITGLSSNVTYQFSVLASNAQGSSALSSSSNSTQLVSVPSAPTGVQAVAGDGQASVSWTAPASTGGLPLSGNTVTALANGVVFSTTAVSASATSALVSGLTNGVAYTFTVHATNSVGDSPESVPSSAVTPHTAVVSIAVSGPYSFINTPAIASYKVAVSNISSSAVNNVSVSNVLSTIDGAYILAAQPGQGTCAQGGIGIANVSCSLSSMAPGAVVIVDVVVQMQGGQITLSSSASGTDSQGASFTVPAQQRSTIHGNPPAGTPVVSISLSVNAIPTDLGPGKPGTINWNLQNTTGVAARNLVLAMVIDNRINITSAAVTGSNSTDPVSCNTPSPGVAGTNVLTCNMASLGGPSSSTTVTAMRVTVNYTAPLQTPLTLSATGYLSFDGSDSSNPVSATSIRVK